MLKATLTRVARAGSAHCIASRAHATRSLHSSSPARAARNPDNERSKKQAQQTEDAMFAAENIENLSPLEVARMKVAYGLVREHAIAREQNVEPPDAEQNPLIDPRSVRSAHIIRAHGGGRMAAGALTKRRAVRRAAPARAERRRIARAATGAALARGGERAAAAHARGLGGGRRRR
eukprot:IDg12938t1